MPAAPRRWKLWKAFVAGVLVGAFASLSALKDGRLTLEFFVSCIIFGAVLVVGFVAWRNSMVR